MIDKVANVESEAPVVCAVFEQIHNWHRRVGETMHKDGFVNTL